MSLTEELETYQKQSNILEWFFTNDCFKGVSLDLFTLQEQVLFREYFMPNWDKVEDYKQHYEELITRDPCIKNRAIVLLEKFWKKEMKPHLPASDPGDFLGIPMS